MRVISLGVLLCLLAVSGNATGRNDRVLAPLSSRTGPEAALVIAPGALLQYEQYRAIAEELQGVSELRLWCYLADIPFMGDHDASRSDEERILGGAKAALLAAGMPPQTPVYGAGHSLGGALLQVNVLEDPTAAQGLILWGSNLYASPSAFPIPTLTLTGDLDGLFRITTAADYFRSLKEIVESGGEDYKSLFPYKILYGVNHGQYATGDMPPNVADRDIPADVDDEVARALIANAVSVYLDYLVTDGTAKKEELEGWYQETADYVQPLYDMFRLEEDGDISEWISRMQYVMADVTEAEAERITVANIVLEKDELISSQPELEVDVNGHINIVTLVTVTRGDFEARPRPPNSAEMLEAKMKNSEGVRAALGGASGNGSDVTCRELNMAAWDAALAAMPQLSSDRWYSTGTTVNFLMDQQQIWGPGWIESGLKMEYQSGVLEIQSGSLVTDKDALYDYMYYCKLLSPARAIEYMYIDGLRDAR